MTRHARPKWHEAYDAQMALWRWYRTTDSVRWLRGIFAASIDGVPDSARKSMSLMYDGEMGRLIECDPIYISGDMCDLVDHARHDFEPEPLLDYDLPTPRAFAYFDRPIVIHDRDGAPLPIQAFSWAQEYTAVDDDDETHARIIDALNDLDVEERLGPRITAAENTALVAEGLLKAYGINVTVYSPTGGYIEIAERRSWEKGESTVKRDQMLDRMRRESQGVPLVPAHLAPWHYDMTFDGNEVDINGEPTGAREWWQLLQTTLRLMQQKIKPHGFGRPDRPTRRAAERLGFPDETEVVIVRLRTEEQEREPGEGGTANYSHRFIRSGHWRNQWYPSIKQHRQIRIQPTIVGDPSLPLIVRPRRVYQWTR